MQSFFIKILPLLVCLASFSCKKMLPSNIIPYSMVLYQENKYIDQTEITVEQWAEFVYDGNEDRKPLSNISSQFTYHQVFYPNTKPDSLFRAFGKIDYYQLPIPKEYFDTLNYNQLRTILDFPITGISHDDAMAYCDWRTKRYNQKKTSHTNKQIKYVLPDLIVFEEENPLNPKIFFEAEIYPVKSKTNAKLNKYNAFGLQSNVAEMTGNPKRNYGSPKHLESPNKLLGFRCVGLINE